MLKGFTKELPPASLCATHSRNRRRIHFECPYGVQHVGVVHCAILHTTSLLACDSMGHGSWLGAAGQLPTHCS